MVRKYTTLDKNGNTIQLGSYVHCRNKVWSVYFIDGTTLSSRGIPVFVRNAMNDHHLASFLSKEMVLASDEEVMKYRMEY